MLGPASTRFLRRAANFPTSLWAANALLPCSNTAAPGDSGLQGKRQSLDGVINGRCFQWNVLRFGLAEKSRGILIFNEASAEVCVQSVRERLVKRVAPTGNTLPASLRSNLLFVFHIGVVPD